MKTNMKVKWLTNDAKMAKVMREIDDIYEEDLSAAKHQRLTEKIATVRKARLKYEADVRKRIFNGS